MIPHGGTYAGNAATMAAADAVLDVISEGALKKVDAHGKKLMAGWKKVLDKSGVPYVIQGPPSMPGIVLTEKDVCLEYRDWADSDHDLYEEIIQKLFEKGVMPDKDSREPWFISASHSDEDADFTLNAFEEAVKEVCG
jgi:glutamate-1-semialdehyde 2,1-aminomutase